MIARSVHMSNQRARRSRGHPDPDVVIAARLRPGNDEVLDYYLLPRLDVLIEKLIFRPENGLVLDVYRFNNLNFFMEMAQRARVESAA